MMREASRADWRCLAGGRGASAEASAQESPPEAPAQSRAGLPVDRRIQKHLSSGEQADALVMIDQHAAHERILYEKFKSMLDRGTASQQLLTPLIVPVSARERAVLMDNLETLNQAGFEVEPFGERDMMVRAVPFVLSHASLSPFFMEMIEQLDRLKGAALDRRRGELIQLSCKRAVKAGDRLTEGEIQALLDEMAATNAPPNCPHGRPVMRVFRTGEIERMFKRIQ
jgi:DNA mismatch repair protein MutL